MRRKIILLVSVVVVFTSCNQNNEKKVYVDSVKNTETTTRAKNIEGYTLMKNNCYVCHNPSAKSHDSIIAPPFKAVKMHYTKTYDNKKDFVEAVVNWVQNPQEDKSLMPGAIKRFKVMPKLPLKAEQLEKIAAYIYDNAVEQPNWMPAHMKEMKAKGMNMNNN